MSITSLPFTVPYAAAGLDGTDLHPTLTAVTLDFSPEIGKKQRPALIICPGGGYDYCSDREAEPIAMRFAGHGVQSFVLRYSCQRAFPTNLLELAAAVAYVRTNAETFDIHPDKIAVCGFSAGGHLAGSLAALWQLPVLQHALGDTSTFRPNAAILSYPVISGGEFRHDGSIRNLIGDAPTEAARNQVSLEKQVTDAMPPVFLWHCVDDGCVPVQNSLLLMQAMSAAQVSYEAHLYPYGGHGLAFADNTTAMGDWNLNEDCTAWFALARKWIQKTLG